MAKLVVAFFLFVSVVVSADQIPRFDRLGRIQLENIKFKKTKIGGISAAFFIKDNLYALSDDRGRVNEPRFYIFNIKVKSGNKDLQFEIEPKEVVTIHTQRGEDRAYLDGEGFVPLTENRLLISCEGDNNHKPRRPPRLFEIDLSGKYIGDWVLPEELIPESLGMQKKGIQNNSGFEGVALSKDGNSVLAAVERPLVQDLASDVSAKFSSYNFFVRLYKFSKFESKQSLASKREVSVEKYAYELSPVGILTGVSEILNWQGDKYFVLERGVRNKIGASVLFDTQMTLIDLNDFKSKSHLNFLNKKSLEVNLGDENFEAMAWGPSAGKYSRTLWIVSDNNFSKVDKTTFLVYGVDSDKSLNENSTRPVKE